MKTWQSAFLRFLGGAAVVAAICATALDREVLKEQLVILCVAAVAAGLICAFSGRAFKALLAHWRV
jgi:hypothetical protein